MGIYTEQLKKECAAKGINYVGHRGNQHSPLWCIGEAPGENEDKQHLPFVGASGQELDRMVVEAGLTLQDVCFTNPYKIRPPDNELPRIAERGIEPKLFLQQFIEELFEFKPYIIVVCGATALGILCPFTVSKKDHTAKIGTWRGSLLKSDKLPWPHFVLPMYHPAFILREWSERQIAVLCLAKALEELVFLRKNGTLQPLPTRELITTPSFDTLHHYLHDVLESPSAVSIDIEMLRASVPYTVAVASSAQSAISFSFWNYDDDQLVKIWRMFDEILRTKPQIGQNYLGFDCHWLEFLGFTTNPDLVNDTLIAHHVLWPEFEHNLGFLGMQYTRQPFWKNEGKEWKLSEGLTNLMHYNCLDAACTYEIFEKEAEELKERKLWNFYNDYEMPLARRYHEVEKRGVLCDAERLKNLREYILVELDKECGGMEKMLGRPVAPSKEACAAKALALSISEKEVFNLNAPTQVIEILKSRGLKIPKDRKTHKESSREEHLQKIFGDTGDEIIKHVLVTRELNKILGTYVDVKLSPDSVLYSSYVITGTVTGGRRSSRRNVFGLGTNHQNIPHHSELGKKFRRCIIARPGYILLNCDQIQAEDWVVQAIIADVSGRSEGLEELRLGVDRHKKLASFIFSLPEDQCGKNTPQRFLGKKVRHAANYAMQAETMSLALAKEGYSIPVKHCDFMLQKFHEFDPSIRGVYHKWVESEIKENRMLRNPHGRERYFLSARPYSDNHKIFRDGYAQVPQSTVGDNTGKAVLYLEDNYPGHVLMESHDAVVLEVEDRNDEILIAITHLQKAFDIELTFPNRLKLKIPIEIEIGYNLEDLTKCDNLTETGLQPILSMLREQQKAQQNTISGAQPPPSVPVSSGMSTSIG